MSRPPKNIDEDDLINRLCVGHSRVQICKELHIHEQTLRNRVANLLAKGRIVELGKRMRYGKVNAQSSQGR